MLKKTADTLRLLAADMVQKANSGHPGLPMGMADCATILWTQFLKYNPNDPDWPGRDRFILSGGHGSALLYSLLHLAGYDMSLDDLKEFRQWESRTPGHPECNISGVETTTGPLGQGLANAVGMALAATISSEKWDEKLFGDHFVYCFFGDGDVMEGLSHEASSLAAHLALDKLICFYDSNRITIDGSTDIALSEDVAMRYKAYGWHVQKIDGHDHEQITRAIIHAQKETQKPSLIIAETHIAFGSPNKQDTPESHGSPLGEEEIRLIKKHLGFPEDETFFIPRGVKELFKSHSDSVQKDYDKWQQDFEKWKTNAASTYKSYEAQVHKVFPADLKEKLLTNLSGKPAATRAHSGNILQILADRLPGLIGGSADLAGSCKTTLKNDMSLSKDNAAGRNIHFGIREFAMGAVMNGMALYGSGLIPYGGTFLVFSDYMRSAIRLSALMEQQVIYVFTHDSIFVGEDGPTHQPVEQLMSLRLIPGLQVIRPADEIETAEAWLAALEYKKGPTALILTRQKLPNIHTGEIKDFKKGAFTVLEQQDPDTIICASGSEVSISLEAAEKLNADGHKVRVLSCPSYETFLKQEQSYRDRVIPPGRTPVVTVEAGRTLAWGNLTSNPALHIGIDKFGASAPHEVLSEKYGLTAQAVYKKIKAWLK